MCIPSTYITKEAKGIWLFTSVRKYDLKRHIEWTDFCGVWLYVACSNGNLGKQ